jgi:hypothetical protein
MKRHSRQMTVETVRSGFVASGEAASEKLGVNLCVGVTVQN